MNDIAVTDSTISPHKPRQWHKPPFIENRAVRRLLWAGALVYLVFGIGSLDINWDRIAQGLERGLIFLQGFLKPDFVSRGGDIWLGFRESLTMTVTSTAVGVALSIPIAVGAARNISPSWIYAFC